MADFLRRLFGGTKTETAFDGSDLSANDVIVVSGLPRSGTSMMMKVLEAGGVPVLVDGERTADVDNPKGYYEFERVKQLPKGDVEWVADAQGKAVKIISALLINLPSQYNYKIIFMLRDFDEVLRSQQKMLENRGEENKGPSDAEMTKLFVKHLQSIDEWFKKQPNMDVLHVDYNRMVLDPQPYVEKINQFVPKPLDVDAMNAVVDPNLYRNRV